MHQWEVVERLFNRFPGWGRSWLFVSQWHHSSLTGLQTSWIMETLFQLDWFIYFLNRGDIIPAWLVYELPESAGLIGGPFVSQRHYSSLTGLQTFGITVTLFQLDWFINFLNHRDIIQAWLVYGHFVSERHYASLRNHFIFYIKIFTLFCQDWEYLLTKQAFSWKPSAADSHPCRKWQELSAGSLFVRSELCFHTKHADFHYDRT